MDGTREFRQGNLTFILTPTHTIVQTPLQAFILDPTAHYWRKKLKMIRIMVELGEVRDLNELASWCGNSISWVPTNRVAKTILKVYS